MKTAVFFVLLTHFISQPAFSQNAEESPAPTEPCPEVNSSVPSDLEQRIACLEQLHEQMMERMQSIELPAETAVKVMIEMNNRLREELEQLRQEIIGPRKVVTQIPAVETAWTRGHWEHGRHFRDFECTDRKRNVWSGGDLPGDFGLPPDRSGFTRFGAALGGWERRRGCQQWDFCDGHAEHCLSRSRERGCFVNSDWYEWFTRRQMPLTYSNICGQSEQR